MFMEAEFVTDPVTPGFWALADMAHARKAVLNRTPRIEPPVPHVLARCDFVLRPETPGKLI
jgi:hypothetical protein